MAELEQGSAPAGEKRKHDDIPADEPPEKKLKADDAGPDVSQEGAGNDDGDGHENRNNDRAKKHKYGGKSLRHGSQKNKKRDVGRKEFG